MSNSADEGIGVLTEQIYSKLELLAITLGPTKQTENPQERKCESLVSRAYKRFARQNLEPNSVLAYAIETASSRNRRGGLEY